MRRLTFLGWLGFSLLAILLIVGTALILSPGQPLPPRRDMHGELPSLCRNLTFEKVAYVVCEVDLGTNDIVLFHHAPNGKPFGSLTALDDSMHAAGTPLVLAMNAGMYHDDLSPVGLYVEDGRVLAPLNHSEGKGNFFLKPNGVFFVTPGGEAAILETGRYGAERPDALFATQSGPLLVVHGRVNPRFEADGTSRYIRNGVGVRDAHTVVLAISRTEVSFGAFARLFRDALRCPDALYLDGVVSQFSNGSEQIMGGAYPAGPILAVLKKR